MERPLVKGRVLIDAVEVVRERYGPDAADALVASLDGEPGEILRGRLLANDWYPLDAMTAFMVAGIRAHSNGDESVIVARAEQAVEQQLRGIYRIFVRLGSPEFVIKRLGAIHQTYFEHVAVSTSFAEERRARVRYTGFQPQHRIMQFAVLGFYRKALQLSGAKNVTATIATPLSADGDILEIDVAWS